LLGGNVGLRCWELLQDIARSKEKQINVETINGDLVHMLAAIAAQPFDSRAVQYLKGKSSTRLLTKFRSMKKRYWGQHLWARDYWEVSSGNVTDEMWKEYIKSPQPSGSDSGLDVV